MPNLMAVRRAVSRNASLACKRCGHEWMPRMKDVRICPNCKTARWDQPKKANQSRR